MSEPYLLPIWENPKRPNSAGHHVEAPLSRRSRIQKSGVVNARDSKADRNSLLSEVLQYLASLWNDHEEPLHFTTH